jgi:hypothetical protein
LVAIVAGCGGFQPVTGPDGGSPDDLAGAASDGPSPAGDLGPMAACRPVPLDCLDPAPANVIEVPTEMSASAAFAAAQANDTIQFRGGGLGAGFMIPAFVTLHGCAGAQITGAIAFKGSGGTVEGFDVPGQIVANQTGTYVIRYNRFPGGGAANQAGVSARSIDALVSASVTAVVDSNDFTGRSIGVEADTAYDTMTHQVDLTVRNNIFENVASPVTVSEGGLVGKITARVEQNTFYMFDKAIYLSSIDSGTTATSGNLFAVGSAAVDSSSPFSVDYSLTFQVTNATPMMMPLSGAFADGDPMFADAPGGDFRLGAGSAAIDLIPPGTTLPATDYFGCPRPVAFLGTDAKGDVGAIEAQR